MIYLTAHRVVSSSGAAGINAFMHACDDVPLTHDDGQAVARAADQPGAILAQAIDLPPGGNHVRSYLDIVANSDISLELLSKALAIARGELTAAVPTTRVEHGIGVRFGAEFGLYNALPQEFDALAARAIALLQDARRRG